jgi:hypothetical protein
VKLQKSLTDRKQFYIFSSLGNKICYKLDFFNSGWQFK